MYICTYTYMYTVYNDSIKVWRFLRPQFVQPGRLSFDIALFLSSDVHAVIAKSMETIKVWDHNLFQRATTLSFHSFFFHLFPVALYASFIVCNKECGDQQSLTILWDRSLLKAQPGCLSIAFLFTCGPQTVAGHEDEVALIQLFTIFQPNTHISPLFQETL